MQWDYYFITQYLFSFQLYHILVGVIVINILFICGSQWLSLVGFSSGRSVTFSALSFRRVTLVFIVLWFWSYDSTSSSSITTDFVAELQSDFLALFSVLSGEQVVYVPLHTYVILFTYVACVAASLAAVQVGALYGQFLLTLATMSGLTHFLMLAGLSIFFGGLWSLYNDFSLLLWSWDFIELFYLEAFYSYFLLTHLLFLGLFSYEILLVSTLFFRIFRLSVLASTHHLSSASQHTGCCAYSTKILAHAPGPNPTDSLSQVGFDDLIAPENFPYSGSSISVRIPEYLDNTVSANCGVITHAIYLFCLIFFFRTSSLAPQKLGGLQFISYL